SRIVWVRPAGERVAKGEELCRLNPLDLRDRLAAREREVIQTRQELNQATLQRQAVELDLEERMALDAEELARAREHVRRALALVEIARLRLEEVQSVVPTVATAIAEAQRDLKEAEDRSERAQKDCQAVVTRRIPCRLREFQEAVRAAEAQESARAENLAQASRAVATIQRELDGASIRSPADGILVYARWKPEGEERGYARIEPGAYVRPGQILFRLLPDPSKDAQADR
ncbi:MAG: hypothetical protein AB7I30_03940, partial [Isosphaeraceae bacterium]